MPLIKAPKKAPDIVDPVLANGLSANVYYATQVELRKVFRPGWTS